MNWQMFGSLADWASGTGTFLAVFYGARQFNRIQMQEAARSQEEDKRRRIEEQNRLLQEIGHVTVSPFMASFSTEVRDKKWWIDHPTDPDLSVFTGRIPIYAIVRSENLFDINNVQISIAPTEDLQRIAESWDEQMAITQFECGLVSDIVPIDERGDNGGFLTWIRLPPKQQLIEMTTPKKYVESNVITASNADWKFVDDLDAMIAYDDSLGRRWVKYETNLARAEKHRIPKAAL